MTYTNGGDQSRKEETWMGTMPSSLKLRQSKGPGSIHGGVGREAVVKRTWNRSKAKG